MKRHCSLVAIWKNCQVSCKHGQLYDVEIFLKSNGNSTESACSKMSFFFNYKTLEREQPLQLTSLVVIMVTSSFLVISIRRDRVAWISVYCSMRIRWESFAIRPHCEVHFISSGRVILGLSVGDGMVVMAHDRETIRCRWMGWKKVTPILQWNGGWQQRRGGTSGFRRIYHYTLSLHILWLERLPSKIQS